ncbi:MAG: sporulation integral membrane protein YtvI [Clostridiales bacterium]|jgi:sporulation integral membrane protein YtvI|nr:sporulation integral membrane protein YtvI [Clostridiales bacterium]
MLLSSNQKDKLLLLLFLVLYTLFFVLLCAAMKYLFPFLAGMLTALLLQPLVRFMTVHLRLKRGAASFIGTLAAFFLVFGLLFWICCGLVSEIKSLIDWISQWDWKPVERLLDRINIYIGTIDAHYLEENKEQLLSMAGNSIVLLTKLLSGLVSFLTSIPAVFTMVLVMIASTYFFTKDLERIKAWLISHFTRSTATRISKAATQGVSVMGKCLSSYLLLYLVTFIESLILFLLLKTPYPLVLSLLAGIADLIPILGPGAVYFPLAVSQWIQGKPTTTLALAIAWLVITIIRQILEPKLVSSSVEIHPLCMLAALYFALAAGNFLVLLYFTLMFILYQILKKVELLPPLFSK